MVAESFSIMCKRGNISERDKRGNCLCVDCKEAKATYNVKWRQANKDRSLILKICVRGNIAERSRDGHCLCVDCKKARYSYKVKWNMANKDAVEEYNKKWYAEHCEKKSESSRKWYNENKEKRTASANSWKKNNPGAVNATAAKRRASLLQQTPQWANLDKIREIYIEAARLTKETGIQHHVDHVIPLLGKNISGLHVHTNLQILTASENLKKSNKLLI